MWKWKEGGREVEKRKGREDGVDVEKEGESGEIEGKRKGNEDVDVRKERKKGSREERGGREKREKER